MDSISTRKKKNQIMASQQSTSTRLPLKETNNNVPSPVLKKQKLTKHSNLAVSLQIHGKPSLEATKNANQQSSKSSRLAGLELYNWQQSWRKIMKESVVYFEGVEEHDPSQHSEYKKAAKALKQVGCTISSFYDSNVTIIISRRPFKASKQYSSNDIFSNAISLKTKVWDYDKVFRFLKNLGVLDQNVATSKGNGSTSNDANLYNLLKEEKIFGTTDRDPTAKRDDFHYFTKNYLYSYDLSQKVRPIAIREWSEDSVPVLSLTLDGKCPFIPDTSENSERKKARRAQKFQATKEYRQLLKKATNEIINDIKEGTPFSGTGINGTSTSTDRDNDDESTVIQQSDANCQNSNFNTKDNNGDDGITKTSDQNDPIIKQKIGASNNPTNITLRDQVPLLRNSSCVQPLNSKYFDLAASGYNGASNANNFSVDSNLNSNAIQGNGLGPTISQVPSKNLNNLKRRIIMKKQQQKSIDSEKERDLRPGYCENCRVKYDNFEDHISSNRHRNFACDDRNFKDIDILIETLSETKSMGFVSSNGDYKYA
ncbi:uncharacterized protein PRCAT00000093001 [Priceomyces carsonii]|uniref:uncharacterized protein n=1 Tax=Priceomyces carsonii TaxID=28549 RepID=UPI002EDA0C95|nr:unnamed protein product [Priceomyces carsonii]